MAKKIKGITVEVGGDTAPLDKALGNVNKKSRSLQVELRQVEKLLKLDPTNTELLVQKQELLSKSVGTTEEKLNALKAAQIQVQKQFENGDIGEEQYRSFQRELIKTENELKNIKNSLSIATRNLDEFGDNNGVAKEEAKKLKDEIERKNKALAEEKEALKQAEKQQKENIEVLKQAEKAQKEKAEAIKKSNEELEKQKDELLDTSKNIALGTLAVGGSALAVAGYSLTLSNSFDKAFNTLITKTGASKNEFDSLNEAMENVYKNNFGESIEDVAESMAIVKVNTNLAGKELELATERALLLRDTFEFDVNESTRTAKMMMEQFGLSSEEAYNLIAQGAQMGLDKNGDLLDTINEYSVHFEQAGYSAEEMLNSLKNGTEAGTFSVDKLGDAVKEFGIRMKDGSDGTTGALKDLKLNVDDVVERFAQGGDVAADAMGEVVDALFTIEDPLKQNEIGVALFGTMFEDLGVKGVEALMYIGGEADRASSTLEDINSQKYDDIGSALAGLGRTIQVDVIEPLGDELKPVVEEVIDVVQENGPTITSILSDITKLVGEFVTFIVSNGPIILSVMAGLTTSFLVLKGLLVVDKVLGFVKGLKLLEGGLKLTTVANKLLNLSFLSNPFVLITTLIAGLVTGLIVLWNTNEDFRNFIIGVWESIKVSAEKCWGAICTFFTETIPNAFNTVLDFIKNNWQGLLLFILNPFAGAFKLVYDNCEGFRTFIDNLVNNILDTFKTWGDNISTFFNETIPKWIEDIGNWFNELPNKIGYAIGEALANIVNWGVDTYNYFSTNIPIWIDSVGNWFSELPGRIWTWLLDSATKVYNWGTKIWNDMSKFAQKAVDGTIQWFSQLPGKVWLWLSSVIEKVKKWGNDMSAKAKQAVKETVDKVINGFKDLPNKIANIGKSVVEGLWRGISNSGDWLWGKISGFAGNIVKGFKDNLKINSPSKIMRDVIGVGIVEGIDVGINKEMPNLNKNIGYNLNSMISKMRNITDAEIPNIPFSYNKNTNISNQTANIDYNKMTESFIKSIKTLSLGFNLDGRNVAEGIIGHSERIGGERINLSERGVIF